MTTKGYRVMVLCADGATTEYLRGGRVYVTRAAAHAAAQRAGRCPVETVPTGYAHPHSNDAVGWDDLRAKGYPAPRAEARQ